MPGLKEGRSVLERLLEDLRAEVAKAPADDRNWAEEPLSALVDHIVGAYHEPLRELLPRMASMAERVLARHGEGHPELVPALVETFRALHEELEEHMHKEEVIVFPYAKALESARGREDSASLLPFAAIRFPRLEAKARQLEPTAGA